MVKINYMTSDSGLDNCFDLCFRFNEYVPNMEERFGSRDMWSYHYYNWLFKKYNLFRGSEKGEEIIWTIHWDCEVEGIPFSMVYDKDYDLISFSLDEEHMQYRERVAEALKHIVEKEAESNKLGPIKNSGFDAPVIGTIYSKDAIIKKHRDGTISIIEPEKSTKNKKRV